MARQVINDPYASGDPTARQRAFQQGFQQAVSGVGGMYKSGVEAEERTRRQQAIERQQNQQDMITAFDMSQKSGIDLTPEDIRRMRSGEVDKPADDMGPKRPDAASVMAGMREQRKAEREAGLAKEERAFGRQKELKQMDIDAMSAREQRKLQKEMAPKTGREMLEKQGAEGKKAIGGIAGAFSALEGMKAAMDLGQGPEYLDANTWGVGGLFSDTDFTRSQRQLSEVVGRLQSGGAINKDEEKRFLAMGPRPGDSADIAKSKLEQQRNFLENKLAAFGLKSGQLNELGFNTGLVGFSPNALEQLKTARSTNQKTPSSMAPVDEAAMAQFQPSSQVQMPFDAQAGQPALMSVDPKKGQEFMNLLQRAKANGQR